MMHDETTIVEEATIEIEERIEEMIEEIDRNHVVVTRKRTTSMRLRPTVKKRKHRHPVPVHNPKK
jgi:phosphate uptake regulator